MGDCTYIVQLVETQNQYDEHVLEPFSEPLTLQEIVNLVLDDDFPMFCRQVDTRRYEDLPDDLREAPYRWFTDTVNMSSLSQLEGAFGDKLVVGYDRMIDKFVSLHTSPLPLTVDNVLPYLEHVYRSSARGVEVKLILVTIGDESQIWW